MSLIHSSSKKAIGENIAIERSAGKPEKQAVAIAFSEKRRAEAKKRVASKMRSHSKDMGHGKSHMSGKTYNHN